jgi:ribosome-binding protein aMBF1 (putative translation factor)
MRNWSARTRLNRWLRQRGTKARWLAESCGIAETVISLIRSGSRNPTDRQARSIEIFTGIPAGDWH